MNPPIKPFKVYQASAGSGKTYTIVKEYLTLCLKDPAATSRYSNILAITFTNKAANEMKAKILEQLDNIINSDMDAEPDHMEQDLLDILLIDRESLKSNARTLFFKIIHDYSNFCICTIDAFFQKVARSFAKDLNLPNQFNVSIDEDEVAEAITDRIGEQLGPQDLFLTKILEDFSETNLDTGKKPKVKARIQKFVKELFSEEAYQKNEANHFETEEQYKETLSHLYSDIKAFETSCKSFATAFDSFMTTNGLTAADLKGKSKSPCLSLVNKIKGNNYSVLTKTQLDLLNGDYIWYADDKLQGLDASFQAFFIPFLREYHTKIGNYLFKKDQLQYLSLYVLRSKIKAETEAFIGEEMVVHISEFNKRINEILGDFSVPFIYERMGEHFRHIFIDEFQDTSVLQWQNLIPLIDNNLANQQENMVVGDGKQSIYRWRNGEVGQIASLPKIFEKPVGNSTFNHYERTFVNSFQFNALKCNFRSFRNIVLFNNAFFKFSSNRYLDETSKKVYCDNDEEHQKEVGIEQECRKQEDGLVQVELFNPDEKPEEAMLVRIKELILELLAHGFEKSDITILVRANRHGSLVANYLHEEGIAVISPESILLKSSDKVQLIVNTLDYLIHRNNTTVIANVIYYWKITHEPDFNGDVSQLFNTVNAIAAEQESIEKAMHLEPQLLLSLLVNSYSLYDLCSSLARAYGFNTISDAFLNFLLDTVYQWQSADEYGIERFLDYWEKKKDHLSILNSETDAVNVMTIHKSKGLEFPVVIYPFVNDDIGNTKTSPKWVTAEALGFDAIPNVEKIQFSFSNERATWSPQAAHLKQLENDKTRLDNMNLNYVAFTRPEQRLYILTQQKDDLEKNPINAFLKNPESDFHLVLQENENGKEWPVIYRIGNPDDMKSVKKKPTQTHSAIPLFHDSMTSDWLGKISVDPNPSMFWMNSNDRFEPLEWGKFVHKILAEITHKEDLEKVLTPYLDNGFIDETTKTMLSQVFNKMIHHPSIREAFSPIAKVKNECELLSKEYGIQRPDRYAELPEKTILIDYKTGKPFDEHRKQLLQYVSILEKIESKPIEAYLVYLSDEMEVIRIDN